MVITRLSFLVRTFGIPLELVINADQTGLMIFPLGKEKTYVLRGRAQSMHPARKDLGQVLFVLECNARGMSPCRLYMVARVINYSHVVLKPTSLLALGGA